MIKTSGTEELVEGSVSEVSGVRGVGGVRMSGTGVCFADRELVLGADI